VTRRKEPWKAPAQEKLSNIRMKPSPRGETEAKKQHHGPGEPKKPIGQHEAGFENARRGPEQPRKTIGRQKSPVTATRDMIGYPWDERAKNRISTPDWTSGGRRAREALARGATPNDLTETVLFPSWPESVVAPETHQKEDTRTMFFDLSVLDNLEDEHAEDSAEFREKTSSRDRMAGTKSPVPYEEFIKREAQKNLSGKSNSKDMENQYELYCLCGTSEESSTASRDDASRR